MKTHHSNPQKTMGIVSDLGNPIYIGIFNPKELKAWIDMAINVYGDEENLHINVVKANDPNCKNAYGIFASNEGKDPHVGVCGFGWDAEPK